MKKIFKFFLATLVVTSSIFYSCETLELEDVNNPNELSPSQADPDLLLNSVQLAYKDIQRSLSLQSGDLARISYMFGRAYNINSDSDELNFVWSRFYSNSASDASGNLGMVANINAIQDLQNKNPDRNLSFHLGIAKAMEAHVLMQLVDFLVEVPWTEANKPDEFPNPKVDGGQETYNAALSLLAEAKTLLSTNPTTGSATDFYYGGNSSKWIKLINTLEMRANLTVGNYTAVINATDVIEDTADDFEFKYGTNQSSPDTRHPDYGANYTASGTSGNLSNWLMSTMVGPLGDASSNTDPRRRYYFYRQNWRTPGNSAIFRDVNGLFGAAGGAYRLTDSDGNGESLSCSLEDTPNHLQNTPDAGLWCSLPLGYWGRLHGNDQGAPPDEFTKTTYGVYPAGGKFDGNADFFPYTGTGTTVDAVVAFCTSNYKQQVALGAGGGGAGILPIYLASYVDFMKAEAHHVMETGRAAEFIRSGLTKSIAKVMSFGALDGSADFSQAPSSSTVTSFINAKVTEYTNATRTTTVDAFGFPTAKDQMDILGEQYFVTMFGGAGDAYNFIRRTGYPRTISRNIDPNPGTFPRSFLYPSNEVSANPNISQRSDNTTKPFWDNGVVNPAN